MATKKCANGHVYDSAIYGDNCPFCPTGKTKVNQMNGGAETAKTKTVGHSDMDEKPTIPMGDSQKGQPQAAGGRTVIRHTNPTGETDVYSDNRRIVGVLISYSTKPTGEIFKIYEGRNYIGRDVSNDIPVTSDNHMSGKHFVILYRANEGIFWGEDQMSSNGSFVNGQFASEKTKLNDHDVIVLGGTKFIFLAVPAEWVPESDF